MMFTMFISSQAQKPKKEAELQQIRLKGTFFTLIYMNYMNCC